MGETVLGHQLVGWGRPSAVHAELLQLPHGVAGDAVVVGRDHTGEFSGLLRGLGDGRAVSAIVLVEAGAMDDDVQHSLGGRVLGLLFALAGTTCGKFADSDPVHEGRLMHSSFYLQQIILGRDATTHAQLLEERHGGLRWQCSGQIRVLLLLLLLLLLLRRWGSICSKHDERSCVGLG